MYYSMDEIGIENTERINQLKSQNEKWEFIYNTAKAYGFEGIHFTPSLYKEFGLALDNIPSYFQEFNLTFHVGGLYKIITEDDYQIFDMKLSESFRIAVENKMHDVSVHPPDVYGLTLKDKQLCYGYFDKAISKWLDKANEYNISLSLETHVSGKYFLFDGLSEYIDFVDKHLGLGILIDISHDYFDNYNEEQIIDMLGSKNVTALHISDARRNVDIKQGTHLAIGDGNVDFTKLIRHFKNIPNIFGALEIKSGNDALHRSLIQLKNI